MENILFKEKQYFRQIWIWLILLGGFAIFTWGLIQQVFMGSLWGDRPAPNIVLIGSWLLYAGLIVLIWIINLEVRISTDRIRYRFYPFNRKFKEIYWEEVKQAGYRRYRPIAEYGGWGIRWGLQGRAYNIAGKDGLQLVFINNSRLLLGTQEPESLKQTMDYLYQEEVVAPLEIRK